MNSLSLEIPGVGFFQAPEARALLEEKVLAAYIPGCRWFGGKARQVQRFAVEEMLDIGAEEARLVLVRVEYADGAEMYQVPLQVTLAFTEHPIARFSDGHSLRDALQDETFRAVLLQRLASSDERPGERGVLRGDPSRAHPIPPGLTSKLLSLEQSNSSLNYGDQIFVKLFRKLEDGMNPDVEITRFLSEQRRFARVPPYAGALEYQQPGREPQVLALALGLVANEGDAWTQTLAAVGEYLALVRDLSEMPAVITLPALMAEGETSANLNELAGPFVDRVRRLGQRTAETHLALASENDDPAFAPEPFTLEDQQELARAVGDSAQKVFALLKHRGGEEPLAAELRADEAKVNALAAGIAAQPVAAMKIRTHGDYHLGQVLSTGEDFVLIDFEGEPQRSLAERKEKRSPLRDVAGMLRSFHYAAHSGLSEFPQHREVLTPWAELWASLMSRTFLRSWLETSAGAAFLPSKLEDIARLLDAFLLEKAIYEVGYELNNRPTWVGIPIRGILQILRSR